MPTVGNGSYIVSTEVVGALPLQAHLLVDALPLRLDVTEVLGEDENGPMLLKELQWLVGVGSHAAVVRPVFGGMGLDEVIQPSARKTSKRTPCMVRRFSVSPYV